MHLDDVLRQLPSDACVEWPGGCDRDGYGLVKTNGVTRGAHRAVYQTVVGPIAPELTVDHLCRNRRCVNPDHMELVTLLVNIRRGKYATQTHCKSGHAFDERNTYFRPGGARRCRACNRKAARDYQRRRRSA